MTEDQKQALLTATSKLHTVIAKHEKGLQVYKDVRSMCFHDLPCLLTYLQDDLKAVHEALEAMEIAYATFERRPKRAA
jgi:hypothetical protein